jgi:hypothetical protein
LTNFPVTGFLILFKECASPFKKNPDDVILIDCGFID